MAVQKVLFALSLILLATKTNGQTNAIRDSILECYNDTAVPGITSPYNRLPATINVLLDLIRKLEDENKDNMDARELSIEIMQRFCQDGIAKTDASIAYGIPYASRHREQYKNIITLTKLLPGIKTNFLNRTLKPVEKCSLHYLISNTYDTKYRGDEAQTCAIVKYRSALSEDGHSRNLSTCPLDLGVLASGWGSVKIGEVLSGIATGLNQESPEKFDNIDNRYASTVVGQLAEVSFFQSESPIELGAGSGFNSTLNPKSAFLNKKQKLHFSDAEIRGSADGLVLGVVMDEILANYSDIKLSQILDTYYTPRGFNDSIRACNRFDLAKYVDPNYLIDQLKNYLSELYKNTANSGATITDYEGLARNVSQAFFDYIANKISQEGKCDTKITRTSANLHIFLDFSWDFETIQPLLAYILDNVDVNKYESTITLYKGDGSVALPKTSHIIDFHQAYTKSESGGFDYVKVYTEIKNIATKSLSNSSYTGGKGDVILIVPKSKPSGDISWIKDNVLVPFVDQFSQIKLLVLTTDRAADFSSLVKSDKDIITITDTTKEASLKSAGDSIITAIKNTPRPLVNPHCGKDMNGDTSSFTLNDQVEVLGENYYVLAPNYFINGGDNRKLRVKENNSGKVTVCLGRDFPLTQSANCTTISGSEVTYDITKYCDGNSLTDCKAIYLKVSGLSGPYKCEDETCRFPNNIKIQINSDNVGCKSSSGAATIFTSLTLLSVMLGVALKVF